MRNKHRSCLFFLVIVLWGNALSAHAYKVGPPPELNSLDKDIRQVVYVSVDEPSAFKARVDFWEKLSEDASSPWHLVNAFPVQAVIGRNGLAPAGEKREGDGRTPSGTFALRRAFGYEDGVQTGLDYRAVTEKDFWIDASASPLYNQWVTGDVPGVSHEILRRLDGLYKYAVVIEYNTDPVVSGLGSAIFLHVWRGPENPTAGCVAMSERDLLRLLRWLDLRQNPVVILSGEPKARESQP